MKKLIHKIQGLGQTAKHVQGALAQAPEKAAQVREAILLTAAQLQALRQNVRGTVAELRAEDAPGLIDALGEIQAGFGIFRDAGFECAGIEMELDPVPRLTVWLERITEVAPSSVQAILTRHSDRKTIAAILSSLLRAAELTRQIALDGLHYRQFRVTVGPVPSVRVIWLPRESSDNGVEIPVPVESPKLPPPLAPPSFLGASPVGGQSAWGTSSFFEERPAYSTSGRVEVKHTSPPAPPALSPEVESSGVGRPSTPEDRGLNSPSTSGQGSSVLDRFKKMPDLTSRRRGDK